ncbi:MAG: carboxypeptidase regulatory-like domain-containing protein, partial [Paludibacteraceae bacterium]|nr:carboxypeptidase regulatory-like domain-containing protein [Paludibacteraceae bacterium]
AREAEPVTPEMVLTDSVGFYEFSRLYMGTYNLSAIADGYLPSDNQEVTLMEHEVEVNFQLVKGE